MIQKTERCDKPPFVFEIPPQHVSVCHLLSRSVALTILALRFSSRTQGEQCARVLGHWDEKTNLMDWLSVTHM